MSDNINQDIFEPVPGEPAYELSKEHQEMLVSIAVIAPLKLVKSIHAAIAARMLMSFRKRGGAKLLDVVLRVYPGDDKVPHENKLFHDALVEHRDDAIRVIEAVIGTG